MRTIANLNGPDFLRAINRTRKAVEKLLSVTGVMKIRKNVPNFTGNETPEERTEMERAQVKQNLNDMLDSLLETHPEETYECIMALCVRDEGEPEPDGIDYFTSLSLHNNVHCRLLFCLLLFLSATVHTIIRVTRFPYVTIVPATRITSV